MNNLNAIINFTEIYDVGEALNVQRIVREGYNVVKIEQYLKFDKYCKFVEECLEKYNNINYYNYSKNKHSIHCVYKNESICIIVRGGSQDVFIDIFCKSDYVMTEFFSTYLKYVDNSESEIECFFDSYYLKNGQVDVSSKLLHFKDFKDLDEDYYPYIDLNILFEQFSVGNENILLCVGQPGRGKSKFASTILKLAFLNSDKLPYDKSIETPDLENQFINVAYVKSPDILSRDEFWRKLEALTPDYVIIDDLDYMLTKRDTEIQTNEDVIKNNFLNQFLSFTDGINKNKTKFIITTNQNYDSIDKAILRKGRIFDILEFRELSNLEALNIWKKHDLSEEEFIKLFSNKEVLSANLGSEISKRTNTKITNMKTYLKEDNISKLNNNKKKLGL